MADQLTIWLNETRIATVERVRGRLRLLYTQEALTAYPLGSPLLSLSLPLTSERYSNAVVRAFLDGLLPEGEARSAIASDFSLPRDDTYGLVRALGRDCAGALIIQPSDEPAPRPATTKTAEPLTDRDIEELVANLRSAPLGVGGRVRISLAGVQEKLLLTKMPNGVWGRPVDGTPSTHILKPEIARYPKTVENEAFCMRLARHLGLQVANVETITVSSRRLIVVERYDRRVKTDGALHRIHQEDFCQALGLPPDKKYEEDGGPSLSAIAGLLQSVSGSTALEDILRATILNVVIANGDAHGKNFSLLHDQGGSIRLAPLYDLMSTIVYGDERLAMYIDGVQRMERVTKDRIVNEADLWGLSRGRASEIIDEILQIFPRAIEAAHDETAELPGEFAAVPKKQLAQLLS